MSNSKSNMQQIENIYLIDLIYFYFNVTSE